MSTAHKPPPKLEQWIAAPDEGPTPFIPPVYIDEVARKDLSVYHPADPANNNYAVRHSAKQDDKQNWYVLGTQFSGNVSAKLKDAYTSLRLRPIELYPNTVLSDGELRLIQVWELRLASDTVLVDDQIIAKNIVMGGWKLDRWTVIRTFDLGKPDELPVVHRDLLTWTRNGTTALSLLSWRAYRNKS